jgi:hypothetical protein
MCVPPVAVEREKTGQTPVPLFTSAARASKNAETSRSRLASLEISVPTSTAATILFPAATPAARFAGIKPVLPGFGRASFVNRQRPVIESVAIKLANGFIGLLIGLHRNEPKPPRLPREFVLNNLNVDNVPDLPKQILQVELGRGEG